MEEGGGEEGEEEDEAEEEGRGSGGGRSASGVAVVGVARAEHGVVGLLEAVLVSAVVEVLELDVGALGAVGEEANGGVVVVEHIRHAAPQVAVPDSTRHAVLDPQPAETATNSFHV